VDGLWQMVIVEPPALEGSVLARDGGDRGGEGADEVSSPKRRSVSRPGM